MCGKSIFKCLHNCGLLENTFLLDKGYYIWWRWTVQTICNDWQMRIAQCALFRKSECAIKLSRKTLQNLPFFVDMSYENPNLLFPFLISCCIIYCYFLKCYSRQLIWLFIFEFLKSEWLLPSKTEAKKEVFLTSYI